MNRCRRIITQSLRQRGLLKSTSIGFSRETAVRVGQTVLLKGNENFSSLSRLSVQYYSTESAKDDTTKRLDTLVNESKVVVFMKGVPTQPMCGFSNAVVQILRMHGVEYKAHNVLDDEAIRQGIKDYSNWPTIPQVYVGGNFVGGCDILLQMHRSGELVEELEKVGIRSSLLDADEEGKPKPDKKD